MRGIKFRGIYPHSGTFFYGDLNTNFNGDYRITTKNTVTPIKEETIGQYTGLKDKNGVEIYDGDIISCSNYGMHGGKYPVKYDDELAIWVTKLPYVQAIPLYWHVDIEIIGNIHQNPEML